MRVQAGDAAAREELILRNWGLVLALVKRFRVRRSQIDDVINEGFVGLIEAVDRFTPDEHPGVRFATFASYWILMRIRSFLRNDATIHMPTWLARLAKIPTDRKGESRRKNLEWIMARCQAVRVPFSSIDSNDFDSLIDESAIDPQSLAEDNDDRSQLVDAMDQLLPLHAAILWRRAGINGRCESCPEISGDLGLSAERIRQIEKRALAELAWIMGSNCAPNSLSKPC